MQISSPFQMNDWEIKKFLKLVLAIQFAMWGVIGLDYIGLEILILRQFIGFIYLTFIPGILILRILKLHRLGNVVTILYVVGLSVATLMFTGLLMNVIYPLFGISQPISATPLIITISTLVIALCILCYVRDKGFSGTSITNVGGMMLSPAALFLCMIPFLSILGTYLVNFHQNNIILMFLIVIIAIIVLLIGFQKFIPKNLYPLAIFIIAISLLFHRSLISMYLWGWDIHLEYYFSNLVMIGSHWDPTISDRINAMLSVVILAPAYSIICNMSLTWVFKIIYPLLYSLVPVGLYRVFQKQTDDRIAFLSCFFFVSLFTFYTEMLTLARQQIAEVFLVLLTLLIAAKYMNKMKRSFLFIVFGMSLAVSHYGISYLYMFFLTTVWLILVSGAYPKMQKLMNKFYFKLGRKKEKLVGNPVPLKANRTVASTFVLLFIAFTLTWYMYVSGSSVFNTIVRAGNHIISTIYTDFLSPEASQAWSIIRSKTVSPLHEVTKVLHHITQFFIVIGILGSLFIRKRPNQNQYDEYLIFSIVIFGSYFVIVAFPYTGFGTNRFYHFSLLFLAPFCIIGGITFFKVVYKIIKVSWTNESVRIPLRVLSVFFAIFLLFNSGFVYEVTKDHPTSISLNSTIDSPRFNDQEVLGAKWLYGVKGNNPIYADEHRAMLLTELGYVRIFRGDDNKIQDGSYIYFGNLNVVEDKVFVSRVVGKYYIRKFVIEYIDSRDIIDHRNKIYDNGGAEVYY